MNVAMPELAGRLVGNRYRLAKKLGQGGMGVVYSATQESLARGVAVKVLLPFLAADAGVVARFKAEAERAGRLSHPHVVHIFDFGADPDGLAWIAMELLEGEPLGERIAKGALSEHEVVRVAREVLAALEAAHAQRLVHRDLKPDNVFLSRVPGVGDSVKVLDFGIAKALDAEGAQKLTATGMLIGTPLYMAPEQAGGRDVDERSDIYSLGVVLYEALTGRVPFEAMNYSGLVYAVMSLEPQPVEMMRPGVTPELARFIHRAMAKDPNARFQGAREMAEALARIAIGGSPAPARSDPSFGTGPTVATPMGPATTGPLPEATPKPALPAPPTPAAPDAATPRSRIGLWIGVAIALAVAAFAGAYALGSAQRSDDDALAAVVTPAATVSPIPVAPVEQPMLPSAEGAGAESGTGTGSDTDTDTDTESDPDPDTDTDTDTDPNPRAKTRRTRTVPVATADPPPIPDEGPPPAMPAWPRSRPGARVSCSFVSAPNMPFQQIRPAVNAAGGWGRCWPPEVPVPSENRGRSFRITISGGGRVQNVEAMGSITEPQAFRECAMQHLRAVVFPPSNDRRPTTFEIGFTLDELPSTESAAP